MQTVTQFIDNRLTRSRVRFIALGVIIVALLALTFSFATQQNNRTRTGVGLGGDYLAFYNAGTILNQYGSNRLYDLELQAQLYHQNLPGESDGVTLPFANAPLIAVAMRPFAMLPYTWSYAMWTFACAGMFIGAFALAYRCSKLPGKFFAFALVIALSFEPFIIENIHGGQISTIGMLAISAAIYLSLTSRPFTAGLILSICTYKPTLLPIILPMLVITKQWKTLAGFFTGAVSLATISLALVGSHACVDYVHMLTGYANKTATGNGGFAMTKFIDLNSFGKMIGIPSIAIFAILACSAAAILRIVWTAKPRSGNLSLAWALAISATLIVNLYVGVYDTILLVPAVLLTMRSVKIDAKFLAMLWIAPWITSSIAHATGVQVFTIAIAGLVIYQLRLLGANDQREVRETLTMPASLAHNAIA